MIAQGPGRWADPARNATDVAAAVRLAAEPSRVGPGSWLGSWLAADAAARAAADAILDADGALTEPRLARDLAAALPDGSLLWAASSLPVRDLDHHWRHARACGCWPAGGPAASTGSSPRRSAPPWPTRRPAAARPPRSSATWPSCTTRPACSSGRGEPRPDLAIVVVNNDGGGIFSTLEQAAFPGPFERVFGTPHGARLGDSPRPRASLTRCCERGR